MIGEESADLVWDLVRVISALGAVIILIFLTRRIMNKFLYSKTSIPGKNNGALKIKQRMPLGVKKQLVVAELGNRILLLAVTEDGVQLIKDFPAREIAGAEGVQKKEKEEPPGEDEGEEASEDEA